MITLLCLQTGTGEWKSTANLDPNLGETSVTPGEEMLRRRRGMDDSQPNTNCKHTRFRSNLQGEERYLRKEEEVEEGEDD